MSGTLHAAQVCTTQLQITKLLSLHHLLGGEVEVEAILEPGRKKLHLQKN